MTKLVNQQRPGVFGVAADGVSKHRMARRIVTPFATTEELVEELRNGRAVVIVDAEDRENEGDIVIPAQMATPQAINFMATHGRGLICLALTRARAEELHLTHVARSNGSRYRTAFAQSIEAREGITTGISAHDRARTIATAIDSTKAASDIISPGHVFPLIARDGGVLVRAGHTEASVDLARLAGLLPAAVICEIMNADGTMARVPDLLSFAQHHRLRIGTIEELISFRLEHEHLVSQVAETKVHSTYGGSFDLKVFVTSVEPGEHLVLIKGDLTKPGPVLVRVHAINPVADLIGIGAEKSGDPAIAKAMRAISREGRGVLVLIARNGPLEALESVEHPAMRTSEIDAQYRLLETGIGCQILKCLGVRDMVLLTTSAICNYVGVEAFGLSVVETRRLA